MPDVDVPDGARRSALSPRRPVLERVRRFARRGGARGPGTRRRRLPCVEEGCLFNHGRACQLAWMEEPRRRVMDRNHCPNYVIFDGNEVLVSLSSLF